MSRLANQQVTDLLTAMRTAYQCEPVETQRQRYDAFQRAHGRLVQFEAPLGTWIGTLAGFAAALKLQGKLPPVQPIVAADRFNAQGIEGKIAVRVPLATALLYAVQCDAHRFQILE